MGPWSDVPPTWGAQLAQAERVLAARAGEAARDEALSLLGSLLGEPTTLVLARPATPMSQPDVEAYRGLVARRVAGEAVAHITGRLAFMGLDLAVTHDSPLISPAAQRLVEVALECARHRAPGESGGAEEEPERARYRAPGELSGAVLGAGCGAVALALVTFEPRFARIYAVDPSPDALRVAGANGGRYLLNLVIDWREGDGLGAIPEPVDMIVCDLSAQSVPTSVAELARLCVEGPAKLRPGGALFCALDGALGSGGGVEAETLASLARALPTARIWAAPTSGGAFVAVAQAPRSAAGRAGDEVFGE